MFFFYVFPPSIDLLMRHFVLSLVAFVFLLLPLVAFVPIKGKRGEDEIEIEG